MQTRIWLVAISAAFLAQSPATELRFDWPRDLVARVETVRTQEQRGSKAKSTTIRASARLRVASHAEGLSIKYDELQAEGPGGSDEISLMGALASASPALIVTTLGDFVRADDLDLLRANVRKFLAPLLREGPPEVHTLLEQALSDEVLTRSAAHEWELLVGGWRGLPLTTAKQEVRAEESVPMLPGVRVPLIIARRMVERTECTRSSVVRDCAVVEMSSVVDQEGMKPLLDRMTSGGVKYERFEFVTTTRVRLETDTMVPHELTVVRTADMTATVPRQGRTTARQVERRSVKFTY